MAERAGMTAEERPVPAARLIDVKNNTNPLRKIVRRERGEHGLMYEVLECGHRQLVKEDIYGPTNAYSRRCRRCGREEQQADA